MKTGGIIPEGTSGATVFPNGTTYTANVTRCWDSCAKKACCMLQFSNTSKTCSLSDMIDEGQNMGNAYGQGYRITYKRDSKTPASLIGEANSATKYYRCKLHTQAMFDAYSNLGLNLDAATAQVVVATKQWEEVNVSNEQQCRQKCSGSMLCWGFILFQGPQPGSNKDVLRCLYRGGNDTVFGGSRATYASYVI